MIRNPFTRRGNPHLLAVSMTGVKMGDRVAFVGCPDGDRLAAVASRVGLSGRAVAVVPDEQSASLARRSAERAGILVELEVAPPSKLPLEDGSIDLAVVDDTAGLLGGMLAGQRPAAVHELIRILRPGGRVIVFGAVPPVGVARLISRAPAEPPFAASGEANTVLAAHGFGVVRTLAQREGLVFVEGIKQRGGSPAYPGS
jgi:ubiquinone/menaquinone biosynthesis C-methylase UbiE